MGSAAPFNLLPRLKLTCDAPPCTPTDARHHAQSARLLHELGQEERVHQILAPLPGIAAALREPGSYISSIGQLNKLTGQILRQRHRSTQAGAGGGVGGGWG